MHEKYNKNKSKMTAWETGTINIYTCNTYFQWLDFSLPIVLVVQYAGFKNDFAPCSVLGPRHIGLANQEVGRPKYWLKIYIVLSLSSVTTISWLTWFTHFHQYFPSYITIDLSSILIACFFSPELSFLIG
jgi:hypothetical protein